MIYLDNAATTRITHEVIEEMLPFFGDCFGNPGAIYKIGREAAQAVDRARERIARLFGAKPEQIIFTSGGSEANNAVFAGMKDLLLKHGKSTIIVSETEHDSVKKAAHSAMNTESLLCCSSCNKKSVLREDSLKNEYAKASLF